MILAAALFLAGCAAPKPPLEEPTIATVPPALIAEAGVSLYVFEGPGEWWKPSVAEGRITPAALKELLRHGLSHKSVILVGHADFLATSGFPAEATLFNPDSEAHKPRSGSAHVGFRIWIKAAHSKTAGACDVEWKAEKLTDRTGKNREIQRDVDVIAQGSQELAFGEGILIPGPESRPGREFTLVLRITSLEKP
jgi:hypothetical protein